MRRTFSTAVNNNGVNIWLLIARLVVGALMLTHGIPKLQNLVSGNVQFADPFGIGATASLALTVFAEAFCSILLILGLATRLASVPLIINMLVAIFYAHATQPLAKKELAIVYLIFFVGFLILGGGKYSVDSLIFGKNRSRY
ncbi:DoxX family protein [Segetibacter sp.]|jgi:putative oxidoreductase|uniref:DoxX family protein n=1 Tax=Segetibacter sp. TaxID=2231182 RepID=UPI00260EEF10|nr:DoxX family protein [Segetibacter sp.]MCW3082175.1 DoxX family protein [Segetibacter sp.]